MKPITHRARTKPIEPRKLSISYEAVAQSRQRLVKTQDPVNPFAIPAVPPGVAGDAKMAMDDAFSGVGNWGYNQLQALGYEGQAFIGFPLLSELAQRPEHRKIVEIIAVEATRRWIKVEAAGDDDKTGRINELTDALSAFRVRDRFREATELDGFFGRAHIFLDFGTDDPAELKMPIGNGSNGISKLKLKKGCLKGIRCIEPIWVYPTGYNSTNPLKADWYKPQSWRVQGTEVHGSRLLTLVSREVPDILKPAYLFGGLSLTQIAKPYVDNWLRARQSSSDAMYRSSIDVFKTNMASVLNSGDTGDFFRRLAIMANTRDVNSILALDKDAEDFVSVSKQLGGLQGLQGQAQEQVNAMPGIPNVKMWGITPSGLNASSDGEMRAFYDGTHAFQERFMEIPLDTVFDVVQVHLWGAVDPDLTYRFEPLWTLDEKEQAEVNEIKVRTLCQLESEMIVSKQEVRKIIAGDENMPFNGLKSDDLPAPEPGELLGEPPAPVSGSGAEQSGVTGEQAPAPPQQPARQPLAENADRAA